MYHRLKDLLPDGCPYKHSYVIATGDTFWGVESYTIKTLHEKSDEINPLTVKFDVLDRYVWIGSDFLTKEQMKDALDDMLADIKS